MKAHERIEWAVAYSLAFVSAATASLYGFMSASGPYGFVKGAGLFSVAFIGCHGPAWIVKAKRRLGWPGALFGLLVTAVCLTATLWGGLGTNASGGALLRAERAKVSDSARDDQAELKRLAGDRAKLPTFVPTNEEAVTAAREAVASAERARTAECETRRRLCREREADETARRTELASTLANRAVTVRAEKIDTEAASIRTRQSQTAAPIEADPQASAFFQLTGIPAVTSAALYAFWLSLAFELGAMFAMLLAYSNTVAEDAPTVQPEVAAAPSDPQPELSAATDATSVDRFVLACLPRYKGSKVTWVEIFTQYVSWCAAQGIAALDVDAFGERFAATCRRVRIPVRKRDGQAWCVDVRLVA